MTPELQSIFQQAIKHTEQANFSQAKLLFNYILKIQPKNFDALYAMGFISGVENNHQEAVNYSLKALKIKPDALEVNINCAKALQEIGKHLDSVRYHQKAIFLSPNNHEVWLGCGKSLQSLKRYDEAIAHYDKALSLNPEFAPAWSNKGNALNELRRYDEAITHFDKALSLNPEFAPAWSNKGNVLNELRYYDEAIAHFDRSLSLKPDYAEAWLNKGVSLNELKRYDEAITHFDKALSFNSDIDWTFGDLVHTKMKMCAWSGLADLLEMVSKKVMADESVISPLPIIALNDNVLLHKKSSEIYIEKKFPKNLSLGPIHKYPLKDKIRIGYFSADLRNHPVSFLTSELFELHDKNKFEIIAFSFGADDKSPMRSRLCQAFNQFIDVSNMSDLNIAKLSRDLNINIAVDLGGHTAGGRTGIFSFLAAPIQLSYIGYLGTMGAEYFDYLIADEAILPLDLQKFYSEKIIYLPCFQVNDRKRTISDKKYTKAELGIPETAFVFCCFNNNYKIMPDTFDRWMKILGNVKGSILFLYAENKWAEENLRKHAESKDINSARLIFGGHLPNDEYLARYRVCDLFLDTFPYNAGTTASDALWAGLPVLTMTGNSFASRIAASLLSAIGLPELITTSQAEYESMAIELAQNPQKLAFIKQKLANNRLTTPLFDTPLFTKNLEAAYIKMHERYRTGLKPDHIYIA
jgi:predicted O-linked N-acetylglucosamine transferase (SPINDLY family)